MWFDRLIFDLLKVEGIITGISTCYVSDTNFLEVLFEAKIKLLIRMGHFNFKFGPMPTWKFFQKNWNKLGMGLDYSCNNIQRTFRYSTYSCNRIEYALYAYYAKEFSKKQIILTIEVAWLFTRSRVVRQHRFRFKSHVSYQKNMDLQEIPSDYPAGLFLGLIIFFRIKSHTRARCSRGSKFKDL